MLDILKALIGLYVAFSLVQCTHKTKGLRNKTAALDSSSILIDPDIYKTVPFTDNSKTQAPYLSMNIDFTAISDLRKRIEAKQKVELKHLGEAHITVIAPQEYEQLKSVLTMELINEVALLNRIQESPFQIICLGRGQLREGNKTLLTYFIVIEAPELMNLRQTIATLYKTNGGQSNAFRPEEFYPHITVGFTERDLHLSDGVIKDKTSCLSEMRLK